METPHNTWPNRHIIIFIIIINRIFIQDINHFSPKRTVINVSPVINISGI